MSTSGFGIGGLRFWTEEEIQIRELFTSRIALLVYKTLLNSNPAWSFYRMEGPCLIPHNEIPNEYSTNDYFTTEHEAGGQTICLRPETTKSSYVYAKNILAGNGVLIRKPPLCVWQAGKSFRRELNDGASAAKLRFNEFWQLEFQCIYHKDTKNDYRALLMPVVEREISRFTFCVTQLKTSERLPAYSDSTVDIEACLEDKNIWMEVASCSIRNDFDKDLKVCEIAIGLDRVVSLAYYQ